MHYLCMRWALLAVILMKRERKEKTNDKERSNRKNKKETSESTRIG